MIETVEYLTDSGPQELFLVIEEGVPLDFRTSDAGLLLRRVEEYGTLRRPTHSESSFSLLPKKRGTLDAIDDRIIASRVANDKMDLLCDQIVELEGELEASQRREASLVRENAVLVRENTALKAKVAAISAALGTSSLPSNLGF